MTTMVLAAGAFVAYPALERRFGAPTVVGAAFAIAAAAISPGLAVVAGIAATLVLLARRHRQQDRTSDGDGLMVAELVVLGLRAGLSFSAALRAARNEVSGEVGDQIDSILRRAHTRGLASALQGGRGAFGRFTVLCGRAVVSGAPLDAAVRAFVAEQRDEQRTNGLAAARRLPVRMLFPLALLILPGFVILTLGPALLSALNRLQTGL